MPSEIKHEDVAVHLFLCQTLLMGSSGPSFLVDVDQRRTDEGGHQVVLQLLVAYHGSLIALVGLGHMILENAGGLVKLPKSFWQPRLAQVRPAEHDQWDAAIKDRLQSFSVTRRTLGGDWDLLVGSPKGVGLPKDSAGHNMKGYSAGIGSHADDRGFRRPVVDQASGLNDAFHPDTLINLLVEGGSCDFSMSLPLRSVRLFYKPFGLQREADYLLCRHWVQKY